MFPHPILSYISLLFSTRQPYTLTSCVGDEPPDLRWVTMKRLPATSMITTTSTSEQGWMSESIDTSNLYNYFHAGNGSSCFMVYKCDCTWWSFEVCAGGGCHGRNVVFAWQSNKYFITRFNTSPFKKCLRAQFVENLDHGFLGVECMLVKDLVAELDQSNLHNCASACTHSPLSLQNVEIL